MGVVRKDEWLWCGGEMSGCGVEKRRMGVVWRRDEWMWCGGEMSGCGVGEK